MFWESTHTRGNWVGAPLLNTINTEGFFFPKLWCEDDLQKKKKKLDILYVPQPLLTLRRGHSFGAPKKSCQQSLTSVIRETKSKILQPFSQLSWFPLKQMPAPCMTTRVQQKARTPPSSVSAPFTRSWWDWTANTFPNKRFFHVSSKADTNTYRTDGVLRSLPPPGWLGKTSSKKKYICPTAMPGRETKAKRCFFNSSPLQFSNALQ